MTRAVLALLLLSGGLVSPAQAQPPNDSRYRAAVRDALAELERGHAVEARALFLEAHRLYPNARTLRGVGMASFAMRDYARAYVAFGQSLASTERPLDERLRDEVTRMRERARSYVAVVAIERPSPSTLTVDDAVPDSEPLVLGLGEHRLVVQHGDARTERAVHVEGGESLTLEIPSAAPPVAAAPPAPLDSTLGHVLLVIAGVLTATGSVAAAVWAERDMALASCRTSCSGVDAAALERDVSAALTLVSFGGGLTLTTASLAVLPL